MGLAGAGGAERLGKREKGEAHMSTDARAIMARSSVFRWVQLAFSIVCMVMIANLQYGWRLFADPIDAT